MTKVPSTLYLGTSGGLFLVRPGATSPEALGLRDEGDMRAPVVIDRDDSQRLYAGTTCGGVFCSTDGGRSWNEASRGIIHRSVWAIAQHPRTGTLVLGTSPAEVYLSRDRGDTWQRCDALGRLPSTKGWTGPVPPHLSRMKGFALHSQDPNPIYGAIEEGWAVRSPDGGITWQQIATGLDHDGHWIVLLQDEPDTVVASTGAGIFRSEDAGAHWTESNTGLGNRRYTAAPIAAHPSKPNTLLTGVTAVGPGGWSRPQGADSAFARSEDGGRTWTVSTAGLPQPCTAPPRALASDPAHPDRFYAGFTDGTVWTSRDGGVDWEPVLGGLPPVMSIAAAPH